MILKPTFACFTISIWNSALKLLIATISTTSRKSNRSLTTLSLAWSFKRAKIRPSTIYNSNNSSWNFLASWVKGKFQYKSHSLPIPSWIQFSYISLDPFSFSQVMGKVLMTISIKWRSLIFWISTLKFKWRYTILLLSGFLKAISSPTKRTQVKFIWLTFNSAKMS